MQFSSLPINDFNENWYLGVFCSEELVGNYEICIQGHFFEATIFKMAPNRIVKLSMVSDFNENWYLVFWSEELVGNDEICIQGHFYEATNFWMQISSLPTNFSLQNNPRYQFSLKSETIDNFTILLAAACIIIATLSVCFNLFITLIYKLHFFTNFLGSILTRIYINPWS
jgi:hypothetical protein